MLEEEQTIDPLRRLALQDMSYSRIDTYEWCNLKYYYNYILKIPQDYGAPALLGNIIHKALEVTLEDGEEINGIELIQNYKALVPEYDTDQIISSAMIEEGEQMLASFVNDNPGPMDVYEKEMPFSFVLGRVRLNGFIDMVSTSDKQVDITDYKSGKRMITKKATPTNPQLGIYSIYAKSLFPDKDVYARMYYLRGGSIRDHKFTDEELKEMEQIVKEKTEEILDQENFLPTPIERNCYWCSYAQDGTCSAGVKRLKKKKY